MKFYISVYEYMSALKKCNINIFEKKYYVYFLYKAFQLLQICLLSFIVKRNENIKVNVRRNHKRKQFYHHLLIKV